MFWRRDDKDEDLDLTPELQQFYNEQRSGYKDQERRLEEAAGATVGDKQRLEQAEGDHVQNSISSVSAKTEATARSGRKHMRFMRMNNRFIERESRKACFYIDQERSDCQRNPPSRMDGMTGCWRLMALHSRCLEAYKEALHSLHLNINMTELEKARALDRAGQIWDLTQRVQDAESRSSS